MATLYQCDRCSKIGKDTLIKIEVEPPENRSDYRSIRNIDLCNDCIIALNKFVDPLPKIKP